MLSIALSAVAFMPLTFDKITFDWRPEVGSSAHYKTTNTHKMDAQGDDMLVITWESKVTVDKVEHGRVWLKIDNGEPTASMNGGDAPGVQVEIPDTVEQHGLDGRFYKPEDYDGFGFGIFGGFVLPTKPLDVGETYEVDTARATYNGIEKIGSEDAHKFAFQCRPKSGAWSSGDIWLSTKNLSLLRRKIVMHDVDFGHGPMDIENEIVRTPYTTTGPFRQKP